MDIEDAIVEAVRAGRVRVPPYPAAAMKLSSVLAKPEFDQAELVSVVKTDSMLTAALLRLANSPNYQRGQPVSDITRAIARVGSRQLQTLAMASGVQSIIEHPGALTSLRRRAWLEGLCSAKVCEVLAAERGVNAELAFVAGLLHDLGRLLVIATLEDILKTHPDQGSRSSSEWWSLVERLHLELGLVLSATWKLPDDLVTAITEHHEPDPTDPILQCIAVSDEVVRLLDERAGLSVDELGGIGSLSTKECLAIATALEGLPEFISAFELDSNPDGPSKIADPVATRSYRPGVPVVLHGLSTKPIAAEAVATDEGKLVLMLPQSVRTNVLGRLELSASESMHVRVVTCVAVGDHFIATVSPFALQLKQHAAWKAFGASLTAERAA